jgi:hypothetical protein
MDYNMSRGRLVPGEIPRRCVVVIGGVVITCVLCLKEYENLQIGDCEKDLL